MATSRRTFLGVTVGAAALTMIRPLADAVVVSDQNATSAPEAPATRPGNVQRRPKSSIPSIPIKASRHRWTFSLASRSTKSIRLRT